MIRLAARRLWTRRLQALAPLVALLAATLGFQAVLVSARSTQSHIQGVIAANWNPPFDLLVRPESLVTGFHANDHLIRPNYLDSAQGGISMQEVAAVRSVAGVSVAAPVGVVAVDYLWGQDFAIDLSSVPRSGDLTAYRITTSFTTDAGLSKTTSTASYNHLLVQGAQPPYMWIPDDNSVLDLGGHRVNCYYVWCYTAPAAFHPPGTETLPFTAPWAGGARNPYVTELTAAVVAVDPAAEAQLSGLGQCVVGGRDLTAADAVVGNATAGPNDPVRIPVLVNAKPGYDDQIRATIEEAPASSLIPLVPSLHIDPKDRWPRMDPPLLDTLSYHRVGEVVTNLDQAWNGTNGVGFTHGSIYFPSVDQSIDALGPVTYSGKVPNLAAQPTPSFDSTGFSPYQLFNVDPPAEVDPVAFHTLQQVAHEHTPFHAFDVVGKYDPTCVPKVAHSSAARSTSTPTRTPRRRPVKGWGRTRACPTM